MLHFEELGLLLGAIALGGVHGVEPGHGWPVAATYALDQTNKWLSGLAASLIIGVGHLISSIAMVGVFFYAKAYFDLTQVNEPMTVFGGVQIGGPVSLVAGVLLIVLGLREYFYGHSHGSVGETGGDSHDHHDDAAHAHSHDHHHEDTHDHSHDHQQDSAHTHSNDHHHEDVHDHSHDHQHGDAVASDGAGSGWVGRLKGALPFVGGHSHDHGDLDEAADRGLFAIAWFAFLLGFAHEEEFEIIALCAGSTHCLELMAAYAFTVIGGIVTLTLLLIGGYEHFEEQVEQYTPYLPVFSAVVLVGMGVGFILGLF
ncbi:MAG: hypothetical protein ABEH81_04490 [Halopenitus sp.]